MLEPRLYMHKENASLYVALLPNSKFVTQSGTPGSWKCVRISAKNKWSYEVIGQHYFGYDAFNDGKSKFKRLDIQEEFGRLPEFQRKIMRAVFGSYKGWG